MNMYCCYDNKQLLISQYMYIWLYFEKMILIVFSFYNDATSFINVTTIDKMVTGTCFYQWSINSKREEGPPLIETSACENGARCDIYFCSL